MIFSHQRLVLGLFIIIFTRTLVSSQSTTISAQSSPSSPTQPDPSLATIREGSWDPPDTTLSGFSIAPGFSLANGDEEDNGLSPRPPGPTSQETPQLLLGGTSREGHFDPGARVELPRTLKLRSYTSLSFRTCTYGRIIYQVGQNSDSLKLELDENGTLALTLMRRGQRSVTPIPRLKLNDNLWHRVFLKYELGTLYLGVDSTKVAVANSTGLSGTFLSLNLWSPEPRLVVGDGITGCILEGANTLLSANDSRHLGVLWGQCSLPIGRNCSGYLTDPCFSQPCRRRGTCHPSGYEFTCECYSRYSGSTCEVDSGSLCQTEENRCQNGGTCQEDHLGNDIHCECPPGFMGARCELTMVAECTENPCMNNGSCMVTQPGGRQECLCPPGFRGTLCEAEEDFCFVEPCFHRGVCSLTTSGFFCNCSGTGYLGNLCETNINECIERNNPCHRGSTCLDFYGGYECVCPPGFGGGDCSIYMDECSSSPCENDANCTDLVGDFSCECSPGFEGKTCGHNIDDCRDITCPSNSVCVDRVNTYECQCQPGFSGPVNNCVRANACASDPCLNGASCFSGNTGFTCICPHGFTGNRCETNIDDCAENPCQSGATCVDGVRNYTCACADSFMGRHCEQIYDICAQEPCFNGGSCIATPGERQFYCECPPGFEGHDCNQNMDDCTGVTCSRGKVCFDLVNDYECRCPEGYFGDNCSVNIDECRNNPCVNGGTCFDATANYTCVCPSGFTGQNCEQDIDECTLMNPCVNGICVNTNGSYECYCRPGFSGDNCSLEFDECLYLPCQNGGTCINMINGYQCQCPPGFTGSECETDIDECFSQPCQNGATCVDGIAAFTCQCVPGFTDNLCATNINECESNPCMNGGECNDGINMYSCNCTDTGFKGLHCETNIDDCESSPCQHGSNCTDLIKDYNCSCYDGYTGKNCEQDIEECASSPCQNDAICLEYSNLTYYELGIFANFSYDTAGGFMCECQLGFTGEFCEINIDECESDPCQFGDCVDGINSFTCHCLPGYEGEMCEHEIDECERYEPCVNGTCIDKIADYTCKCDTDYGGKNCSVLLLGCQDVQCVNGGSCEPLLISESVHDFECHCLPGFTGRNCQEATTLSMNGNAYLLIDLQGEEAYYLQMNFRTTLPSVVLAVGQGEEHYYTLVLQEGRLRFHSSLLSRYNGIFTGSNLNDGEWQLLAVLVNSSHLVLSANNDTTQHSLSPPASIAFASTYLGGVTPNLKILVSEPLYTGCMRDISLNGNEIIPSQLHQGTRVNVIDGCLREPQCQPNRCHNEGKCVDLWTSFICQCKRPYLGDTCRMSFTPATFGNEEIRDSLASVSIPAQDQVTFRRHVVISMLVRTRQDVGLIFYLGSPLTSVRQLGEEGNSYLLAELIEGRLVTKVRLGGPEEVFETREPYLADGDPHLLHVERVGDKIYVKVDDGLFLNETLLDNGDLMAQILYLGGVPVGPSRAKRQLGVSVIAPNDVNKHFKGVLQDIRLSAGNQTRYVELFPLEVIPDENFTLSGPVLSAVSLNNVLNGTVSDNTCAQNPCLEGGNCTVTFNDFECACPSGFKGKTCDELEYCAMYECPDGATCKNLDDGYECLTSATFNGRNSSFTYQPHITNATTHNTFSTVFRSKVGGILLTAELQEVGVWVGLGDDTVVVEQVNGSATTTRFSNESVLDGEWHSIVVAFYPAGLQVSLDNVTLINRDLDDSVTIDFDLIIKQGQIRLGGFPSSFETKIRLEFDNDLESNLTQPLVMNRYFRGCLSESRAGGVLLPFYSPLELKNNTAANVFTMVTDQAVGLGCEVCFQHECQNNGQCLDPNNTFTCSCPTGFEGSVCQVNIDECQNNTCLNNATCVDGINGYTCDCLPGYEGQFCGDEIDECAPEPCKNGATCIDQIASFTCVCTKEYIGRTCEELKVKNCSSNQCQNGATCNDVFNPSTGFADNYTCECPFSYTGYNCQDEVQFCAIESVQCVHGKCVHTHVDKGWKCVCESGFEGELCGRHTNECNPDPCLNGGVCEDLFLLYRCECQAGWRGRNCEENINECLEIQNLCLHDGECIDADGSYFCECDHVYCGKRCSLLNPCMQNAINCTNGECTQLCDETTNTTEPVCRCFENFEGEFCEIKISALSTEYLTIIISVVVGLMLTVAVVGIVIFFMMAKKKRETSGTYSPSKQEFYSPRVEMGNMMKPPPEERLI